MAPAAVATPHPTAAWISTVGSLGAWAHLLASPNEEAKLGVNLVNNTFTHLEGSLPPNYFVNWKASSLETNDDGRIYMGDYNNAYYIYEDTMDLQYKGLFMEQGKVLTSYATIDFSGNRFEGQIPESIGLLKALIALNLSNNGFTAGSDVTTARVISCSALRCFGARKYSRSDLLERRHEVAPAPERLGHSDPPRSLGFVSI
ncbi:hypothetical protein DY000_02029744 [Brassica cretica]|uniref:Malectin-like domain-containing protein n=1 Tax=Brassica cretica TaxID=69181 RepID=A0ABQ7DY16_BRACR|nr:hypothetical protein DY000_02029744 [Brassica cretica]